MSYPIYRVECDSYYPSLRHNLRVDVAADPKPTPTRIRSYLDRRNVLRTKLRAHRTLQSIYQPGLVQYLVDVEGSAPPTDELTPESEPLWLPSSIDAKRRDSVGSPTLSDIEARLRYAQCGDYLHAVRNNVRLKSSMVAFKNVNTRGQKEGLRSRVIIDRVQRQSFLFADAYRHSHEMLLALRGPGSWQEQYQVLSNRDLSPLFGRPRKDLLRKQVPDLTHLGLVDEEDQDALERQKAAAGPVRDGTVTGETKRELSWIWRTVSIRDDDETVVVDKSECLS